ncbi:hypothetical protein EDC27_1023 [Desulfosoma caldarium]|uniref:Uncharacterized protein n=1 Tax=Desulfosoma caldarium TaxID=610254 RepID=A0A3N1VLJ1_9BACT|nr:hypothetical protein EDC27_1023 [Desulfosoma caldarium]
MSRGRGVPLAMGFPDVSIRSTFGGRFSIL